MPGLEDNFVEVMADHTAGDPCHEEIIWTDLTQQEIADRLADQGTPVSTAVVRGLLNDFDFRKRQAQKRRSMGQHPDRNAQFEYIASLKEEFLQSGNPVISMDSKTKEPLGNFFRAGRLYTTGVLETNDHDFRNRADALVIPHGLYDVARNVGHITLGLSHDTSEFACDSLGAWWWDEGRSAWPNSDMMLLLCDGGGSNSYRHYIFKEDLQRLVNNLGLPIRVAHYPPYCSKHNPIEHRMFPHVTRACQGVIFHTLDIVKRFIAKASTRTGLRVTVSILDKIFESGRKASDAFRKAMPILFDDFLPAWNYIAVPDAIRQQC
jgi:hypothetical protein